MTPCQCAAYPFPHRLDGGRCVVATAVGWIYDMTGVIPDRRDLEEITHYPECDPADPNAIVQLFLVECELVPSRQYQEVQAYDYR